MKQLNEAYERSEEMRKKTEQEMQSMKKEITSLRLAIRGETSEAFTPELEKTQVSPPKDQDAKGAEKEKEATKISSLVQRIKVRTEKRLRKGVRNLEYPFVKDSWKRKLEATEEVDIIIHECLDDLKSTERKLVSHRQHRKDYARKCKLPDEDAKLIDFLHNDIADNELVYTTSSNALIYQKYLENLLFNSYFIDGDVSALCPKRLTIEYGCIVVHKIASRCSLCKKTITVVYGCIQVHMVAFRTKTIVYGCIQVYIVAFRCIWVHSGAYDCIQMHMTAFRCSLCKKTITVVYGCI
ncbi:hypothetical protein Taro_042976 [Colocasia esculenta]|uniref:Uncharacterized protein n=1 Tax=Colocasia esculenta TaxID=4460 RepID=A0A843WF81_COLES|nr:hypothetical protein [Colocasia esculenta]